MCCLTAGVLLWIRGRHMQVRLRTLAAEWRESPMILPERGVNARQLAARLGARLGERLPGEVGSLTQRVERAGLGGGLPALRLFGGEALAGGVCGASGLWDVGAV